MKTQTQGSRLVGGPDYAPLSESTIRTFLRSIPGLTELLGGPAADWAVREVGDGNLNLVFIVKGSAGGLVVKQALPYVRLVGESWPLPLDRIYFEHEALGHQARAVSGAVPKVHYFDASRAAIVMELLEPHIILRKALIRGTFLPRLAKDISGFVASTLFATSDFAMPAVEKRAAQALFSRNSKLCKITEDLVFTDPYRIANLNRWTSPQLDAVAARFRFDAPLKLAVQELKWIFLTRGEALLHGDLHTGSVMVTQEDTRIIDPEFAFFGPMGFDIGAFMANLLLAYFAQAGQAGPDDDRIAYREWILDTLEAFWRGFESRFLALWRKGGDGDVFSGALFADSAAAIALEGFRGRFMGGLLGDAIGFAGAKMVRRILGLAHVEDLESIADADRRAGCELRVLHMARRLIVDRGSFRSIGEVTQMARHVGGSNDAWS